MMHKNNSERDINRKNSGATSRRKVDLSVWIADLTYTQQTIAADVIPNAIGGIATFTETQIELPEPIRLFKFPEKLIEALEESGPPDVIGFSNYIWNFSLSYAFAEAVKRKSPETVIVFGGPNYPVDVDEQMELLQKIPMVDFYIIKEGELAFARLLESLDEHSSDVEAVKRSRIPSVQAISKDGSAQFADSIERIRDLTEIPSPYAGGRLDEFFDGLLLPIIQTNRGCPFSCTFCVEGVGYYNKVYKNSGEKIFSELDYIGKKMAEGRKEGGRNDLFIADSNFGMYPEDIDTCKELARTRKKYQWPEYINVATGKNKKERVLEASQLIDGALRLSGSVQSLDKQVLENIKRTNISADGLMELALDANRVGANSYSEIILGLPGDSKATHHRTVQVVMDAGFTNILLFQLMLLPGTDMNTKISKEKFGMVSKYRVLPRCYGNFELFGEPIVAAEIGEICVASDTLSFEDYVDCRKFHLIVTIFYNDGIFGTLLKLLRQLGLSVYRWMELISEALVNGDLSAFYESFTEATRDELWERREDLVKFVHGPDVIDSYIKGDLGNNLLFIYKTLAITQHGPQLAELAQSTFLHYLRESKVDSEDAVAFTKDAQTYHLHRMTNLFEFRDKDVIAKMRFNVKAYEDDPDPGPLSAYQFEKPETVHFVLEDSQKELVERYLGIYGDSIVGIGRILSKVHVQKLFRHPIFDQTQLTRKSEHHYRISGLQH
ncbi:MAG: cobalamin B12-binding domain-containing protein [Rhodospirillales bacterium]|nr:cobalamin B12-binding domain-containing protein [Rhodospirillales bacterium]